MKWSALLPLTMAATLGCSSDWDALDSRIDKGGDTSNATTSGTAGGGQGGTTTTGTGPGGEGGVSIGGTGSGGAGAAGGVGGEGGEGGEGGMAITPMCNGDTVPELVSGVMVSGNTVGLPNQFEADCVAATGGDQVFAMVLSTTSDVVVTTELPGTNYDAVMYIREVCDDVGNELACADPGQGETYTLNGLAAGTYFVIVDSHSPTGEGEFELLATW